MRLIDADVLKEEIASHFDLELEPVIEKEVLRMIDEQETILVKPPKWISVKDRLPDHGIMVMVYSELCGFGFGYLDGEGKWHGGCDEDVEYWMPLPEPPEVNEV